MSFALPDNRHFLWCDIAGRNNPELAFFNSANKFCVMGTFIGVPQCSEYLRFT